MKLGFCKGIFYAEINELKSKQSKNDMAQLVRSVYEAEYCAELPLFGDVFDEILKDFKYDIVILFFDADRNLMTTGCNDLNNLKSLIESIKRQADKNS